MLLLKALRNRRVATNLNKNRRGALVSEHHTLLRVAPGESSDCGGVTNVAGNWGEHEADYQRSSHATLAFFSNTHRLARARHLDSVGAAAAFGYYLSRKGNSVFAQRAGDR